MGKWLALWKYFKLAAKVKIPLPLPILAVQLFRAVFSCRAANKEVQRVIGTINDGPLYLLGALTSIAILCEERAQISRYVRSYAADHGVAFPDFLNTDEGQLHHTKLCLLSSKQIAR